MGGLGIGGIGVGGRLEGWESFVGYLGGLGGSGFFVHGCQV